MGLCLFSHIQVSIVLWTKSQHYIFLNINCLYVVFLLCFFFLFCKAIKFQRKIKLLLFKLFLSLSALFSSSHCVCWERLPRLMDQVSGFTKADDTASDKKKPKKQSCSPTQAALLEGTPHTGGDYFPHLEPINLTKGAGY